MFIFRLNSFIDNIVTFLLCVCLFVNSIVDRMGHTLYNFVRKEEFYYEISKMTGFDDSNKNDKIDLKLKQLYQILSRKDFGQFSKYLLFCNNFEKNILNQNQNDIVAFMNKQQWYKGLNLFNNSLKRWKIKST